jgi:hypothetical protein
MIIDTTEIQKPRFSGFPRTDSLFTRKLRKVTEVYKHITILKVSNNREAFTRHGMHLDKVGK